MATKQFSFQIVSINTKEFATNPAALNENDEIGISTSYNYGVNQKSHSIVVALELSFDCDKVPFIILKLAMEFDVRSEEFEAMIDKKKNQIVIPKGFLIHLTALTISCSRGVLHEKLSNTELNTFILPSLNVSEILLEDMIIGLS